ncbi:hypothetical protein BGZ75_003250 [Mortierella antarctica]|nr:hypothetical protein BGZ67_010326 [Mortierella alpina]KAF9985195.1 hypothetical protein BGZ75_003250 [Mortierella antarctica]
MLDELDAEFSQEILARNEQLKETQILLRRATQNLTEMRKSSKNCQQQALELEAQNQELAAFVPFDKMDDTVQPLTLVVEDDGANLDLTREAGFMSRVRQQEAMSP